MRRAPVLRVVVAVATGLAAGSSALGLTINANYTTTDTNGGTTGDTTVASDPNYVAIESTINGDIQTLQNDIANPVTLNITFEELPAGNDGLADSNGGYSTIGYTDYVAELKTAQVRSTVDNQAIASLPTSNPLNGSTVLNVKTSLLAALAPSTPQDLSHIIVEFNPANTFYSRSNPVVGKYDLQSAIAHELNECLGIGGAGSNLNSVATNFNGDTTANGTNADSGPAPLDLFRYSAANTRSYTTASTAVSYFSVDGGTTKLVNFNQAGSGSADYGDWGNGNTTGAQVGNSPSQVQDAYSTAAYDGMNIAAYPDEGVNEVTALDAVGWDLTAAGTALEDGVAAPEPTSLTLLGIGALALVGGRRRRARSV
jgi:hypothetical protein